MLFFLFVKVENSTIVTISTFMSGKNLMLSRVEHEKCFITLRPEIGPKCLRITAVN